MTTMMVKWQSWWWPRYNNNHQGCYFGFENPLNLAEAAPLNLKSMFENLGVSINHSFPILSPNDLLIFPKLSPEFLLKTLSFSL